ncbi:MAG: ParB N-terminal domain-containing protein [Acidobacteria bacterium]|nr:ParB N-terminal domain-containing protein [Acidobacteriota bacterium]
MEEISFENDDFRISEDLDSASIRDSIRHVGQLSPVILLDQKPKLAVVCGFRRVCAFKQLGIPRLYARILSAEDYDAEKAFMLSLWDNLSHRQLNPLEKARVLLKLRRMCGIPDERLIGEYLPVLGLAPNAKVLDSYLLLSSIHPGLRRTLIDDRLTLTSLEFLSELPADIQGCMASLMDKIRLSASSQKKLLSLLDELAARTGNSFDAPLKESQISRILEDAGLSSFQKGEKVYDFLYRLVYPRLSHTADLFLERKKQLRIPGVIQIRAHPFFEDPGLRVEFEASDIHRFRQLTAALQDAALSPEAEELFNLD